jgi:phosphoribosyl 1,2-cyclic phosphodiesterase
MTTLYVLGSGSRGNCLAIKSEDAVLLIDAGFSYREIERRAELVGITLDRLVGVVLTHEHGDHARGCSRTVQQRGVPVLTSHGTWHRLKSRVPDGTSHRALGLRESVDLGPFRIEACPTNHDASEPLAIVVRAGEQAIGVAYDLGRPSTAVRYLLRNCAALILEANYDELLLRTSEYPAVVQQRIAGSTGHLSNRAAAELIKDLMHPELKLVVLAHLSEKCNSESYARSEIEPMLKKARWKGALHVARQDEPLDPLPVPRSAVLTLGL